MRYSILATLAATAIAAPLETRQTAINDGQILNYALTLEYLESAFYNETLKKFSSKDFEDAGLPKSFYNDLKEIAYDEAIHVSFLSGALKAAGVTPTSACTYKFGITTVNSFLQLANVLEGVGVSAYLGAAQFISDKAYLTAAGSILTVEARHSAFLRKNQSPPQSPFPAPFDIPLTFNQVYSLAVQFISECPQSNPPLPVKAGIMTTVKPAQSVNAATGWWITASGPIEGTTIKRGDQYDVMVPEGVAAGQEYLVLTSDKNKPTDDNIVAGPAIVPIIDVNTGAPSQF